MIFAVLIYIGVSALLIAGAALFFARTLKALAGQGNNPRTNDILLDSKLPLSEQLGDANKRAAIVAMLERQFHSSPSVDP